MEQWEEVLKGKIPEGDYQVTLENGEEKGLIIKLKNKNFEIYIIFGIVSALRMLEEGIVLNGLFDEKQIQEYKEGGFVNTIYRITNGEFDKFAENIGGGLYHYLGLMHYAIITLNYVIEIITEQEPKIEIVKK